MRRIALWLVVLAVLAGGFAVLDRFFPEQAASLGLRVERMRSGLEEKSLQIPGFDIAYLEGGEGAPLVLVHGIGADKDNFTRVARFLTPHYRVIAIDLPGFGASGKPADADYTVAAQVERLDQILQALQLSRTHLGGSSMGGWIVAAYAAAHPNKVGSLWLLGPAGIDHGKLSEVRRAFHERHEFLLFSRQPADFQRTLDTVFVKRPFLPGSVIKVLSQRAVANYPLHTRIFEQLEAQRAKASLNEVIRGLPVPALIVFGDGDRAVDPADGPVWQSLLPQAQLEVLKDVGHLPMMEVPAVAAQRYLKFREGVAR
jgi:abhydrolase domain-containing protein 6